MRRFGKTGSPLGLLNLLLAGSVAFPVLLFVAASAISYRQAFIDTDRDLDRISQVAREHASNVFDSQSLVAQRVDDLLADRDSASITQAEPMLHQRVREMIAGLPQIASLLVLGPDGHAVLASDAIPVNRGIDFNDRDYVQDLRADGPDKPGQPAGFISQLQVSRINGQPFFGFGIRRSSSIGAFAGIVDIAMSPGFFQRFWNTLVSGEGGGWVVTLVRADGQVLVRFPDFSGTPPEVPHPSPFFDAIAHDPDSGHYTSHSIIDPGTPGRRYAYRKVPNVPVYVAAGRSTSAIVAEWRASMASYLIFGIPATLALFLVTLTAKQRIRGEHLALTTARDEIARRERAEEALNRSQRLEVVGQLTGGIAHDFNNFLTAIIGSLDLMLRKPDDPDRVRRLAENALLAASKGAEVTQKLLAFSRRQMIRPEIVDLNRLLHDVRPLLDSAGGQTMPIEFRLDPRLAPVRLDPGQFEAAILNLVVNARDAMLGKTTESGQPAGGPIVVASQNATLEQGALDLSELLAGRYVRISVTDSGVGMDDDARAKAFEPFFTTKEIGKGTGLGLSQVYGFARQSGGHASIVSTPGTGTTVELILPASLGPIPAPPPDMPGEPKPLQRAGIGETVLVVEDDPMVLATAVESLQELGYTTILARAAAEALDQLKSGQRIDILFSDIVMPGGMNGMQLARAAQTLRPGLKVLLTSGYTERTGAAEWPGEWPLLLKPYMREELAAKLQEVLR